MLIVVDGYRKQESIKIIHTCFILHLIKTNNRARNSLQFLKKTQFFLLLVVIINSQSLN